MQNAAKAIFADDPNLCSHNRMLQDGESVYIVYYLYNSERLKLATDSSLGIDSTTSSRIDGNYSNYVQWGICSSAVDGATSAAGAGACLARIKRQTFLATAHARQELLRMGATRADLLMAGGPDSSIAVPDHETVLKDLANDVSTSGSNPTMNIEKPQVVQQVLNGPRPVSFSDVNIGAVNKADQVNAADLIGSDQAQNLDDTSKHFEAMDGKQVDSTLNGQVQATEKAITASQQADANATNSISKTLLAGAIKNPTAAQSLVSAGNINVLAFKNAMLAIKNAELAKNAKAKIMGGATASNDNDFSAISHLNAETDISAGAAPPPGSSGGTTTVDRELASDACMVTGKGCPSTAPATNSGTAH